MLGGGGGQKLFFSEHGHVAYQIEGDDEEIFTLGSKTRHTEQRSHIRAIPQRPRKMQNAEVPAVRSQASRQQRSGMASKPCGIA